MTDVDLVQAHADAQAIETAAREHWARVTDVPDKDDALIAVRQATSLRKTLEQWISRRAIRAHATQHAHGR